MTKKEEESSSFRLRGERKLKDQESELIANLQKGSLLLDWSGHLASSSRSILFYPLCPSLAFDVVSTVMPTSSWVTLL